MTAHAVGAYHDKVRDSGADAFLSNQDAITKLVPTIRQVIEEERGAENRTSA